jgi:hypothetical protein
VKSLIGEIHSIGKHGFLLPTPSFRGRWSLPTNDRYLRVNFDFYQLKCSRTKEDEFLLETGQLGVQMEGRYEILLRVTEGYLRNEYNSETLDGVAIWDDPHSP